MYLKFTSGARLQLRFIGLHDIVVLSQLLQVTFFDL